MDGENTQMRVNRLKLVHCR